MIAKKYSVADFFAGCGGLSYGFELTGRFNIVLGSDIKPEALSTFVKNHSSETGEPEAILEDIRKIPPKSVAAKLSRILPASDSLDCLVGGPPCEGFSQNRSINSGGNVVEGTATRTNRFMDDPRNELFKWFVQLAGILQPRVVLIENVPDLVRHKEGRTLAEILDALDKAGYMATVRVLNAADYGVPQMRRRTIFLAQRKSDFIKTGVRLAFPEPTHLPYPLQNEKLEHDHDWLPGNSGYWPSVWEAIGDLPPASGKKQADVTQPEYKFEANSDLRRYLRGSVAPFKHHIGRRLGKNGLAVC